MSSNVDGFLKNHPVLVYASDLYQICAPLRSVGIVYFSHAHIDEENRMSVLAVNPDFFQLYFKKQYYQYDLHKSNSSDKEQLILWDALVRKSQSKALHEDFMSFNQGHTFSIIYNHGNQKDCYHFAARLGDVSMNEQYLQRLGNLKKFICYFKETISKSPTLRRAYQKKLYLEPSQGGFLIEPVEADLRWEQFQTQLSHDKVYIDGADVYLTSREVACLQAMSLGRTMDDIAIMLGITPRTVKAHIRHIKDKLQCDNQFQLGMLFEKIREMLK